MYLLNYKMKSINYYENINEYIIINFRYLKYIILFFQIFINNMKNKLILKCKLYITSENIKRKIPEVNNT